MSEITNAEAELIGFIRSHESVITNALHVFAKRMTEAAQEAQAAYEAGASDSLVTNSGFRASAELFRENGSEAHGVAVGLAELLDQLD